MGMSMVLTLILLYLVSENNEEKLKREYKYNCASSYGKEHRKNKALYNEFRRGFLKGYEEGKDAL